MCRCKQILLLSFLTWFSIFAEDVPVTPVKKQTLKEIPHVWLSGDLLYWAAKENRTAYTTAGVAAGPGANFTEGRLVGPSSNWSPGLRLNLGYQPKEWTFYVVWTYINNFATGQKKAQEGAGIFPVWALASGLTTSDYVTSANMRWKQSLNILEGG